jgi:hypothetical protein
MASGPVARGDGPMVVSLTELTPRHAAIMRRYRDRGTVRAAVWTAEGLDLDATLARRESWLTT